MTQQTEPDAAASAFRLYDTATRSVRAFEPVMPGRVSIYHCGLTVQASPHLGHIRKEVVFDVLRRWLTGQGYQVTVIANITDIDDKILIKSAEAGDAVVRPRLPLRARTARCLRRTRLPAADATNRGPPGTSPR